MPIFFMRPIEKKTVWGGKSLKKYFSYDKFSNQAGQTWVFSCQSDSTYILKSDITYSEKTLLDLWNNRPEFFNSKFSVFPVLISLVAPEDDLSIQVHPDDELAKEYGFEIGKNEAWYFLSASDDSKIVYGHSATDLENLKQYVKNNDWDNLICYMPVKQDDLIYIPAGVVHALCKNTVVYEIQASTDVTFRFYDYDRVDSDGNKRPIQQEDAMKSLHYSYDENIAKPKGVLISNDKYIQKTFIKNESFAIKRIDVLSDVKLEFEDYQLVTVVDGSGYVDDFSVKIGDNFLITCDSEVNFKGKLTLMITSEK